MNFQRVMIAIIILGCAIPISSGCAAPGRAENAAADTTVQSVANEMTLDDALKARRSVRAFDSRPLTGDELLQLAWAGQGITDPVRGFRTAPSAGALYPLELYLLTADAVYHYIPKENRLETYFEGDSRPKLHIAALKQKPVADAAVDIVIVGVVERTSGKYKDRAERYVLIEIGHVAQNILLKAASMGLGGVPIGAFYDDRVADVLGLPETHHPYYILALGHPAKPDSAPASGG